MTAPRSTALLVIGALAAALLGGCGGEDEEAAQEVIDQAFSAPIESADVTAGFDLELEGGEQGGEPIRVQATGPFRSGGSEQIPSFDLDVALEAPGSQVPPIGLISTGDNVFVDVQGVAYEVGEQLIARQNRQLRQQPDDTQSGLEALGVDPRDWIVDAEVEDDVDVAGVTTTHVSADVDVPAMVEDLNAAAQSAGEVGAGPAPTLSEDEQQQLVDAIQDPTLDVFVGKDDDILRRLTVNLAFEVPEEARADSGGASGGRLAVSLELANVDGDQRIEAPEDARPLADLAQQLGGLGGLLGGSGGQLAPGGGGSGGSGSGGSPSADSFQQYGECLQQADPSDQDALQACNELLEP